MTAPANAYLRYSITLKLENTHPSSFLLLLHSNTLILFPLSYPPPPLFFTTHLLLAFLTVSNLLSTYLYHYLFLILHSHHPRSQTPPPHHPPLLPSRSLMPGGKLHYFFIFIPALTRWRSSLLERRHQNFANYPPSFCARVCSSRRPSDTGPYSWGHILFPQFYLGIVRIVRGGLQ